MRFNHLGFSLSWTANYYFSSLVYKNSIHAFRLYIFYGGRLTACSMRFNHLWFTLSWTANYYFSSSIYKNYVDAFWCISFMVGDLRHAQWDLISYGFPWVGQLITISAVQSIKILLTHYVVYLLFWDTYGMLNEI